jgi:hypothetical protein
VDSSNGFWEFSSPTMEIDGKSVSRGSGNTAIADTGTTLVSDIASPGVSDGLTYGEQILISDEATEQLYNSIEGAKMDNTQGGYGASRAVSPLAW